MPTTATDRKPVSSLGNTLLQHLLESLKNNSAVEEAWAFYKSQNCSLVAQNDNGESILDVAITYGHDDIATELLNTTAASELIKLMDAKGETALFKALNRGNLQLLDLLLIKGSDANHQNNEGLAPLHCAAKINWSGNPINFFGVLLHHDALPYLLTGDASGYNVTPLQLAYNSKNNRAIQAMLILGFGMGSPIPQVIPPLALIDAPLKNNVEAQTKINTVINLEEMQIQINKLQINSTTLAWIMPHWRWCCYHARVLKPDNIELKTAWLNIFYPKINNLFNDPETWFSQIPHDIFTQLSLFDPRAEGNSERAKAYIHFGSTTQPAASSSIPSITESPLSLAALAAQSDSPELALSGTEKGAVTRTNVALLQQKQYQQLIDELHLLAHYAFEADALVTILENLEKDLSRYSSDGWRIRLASLSIMILIISGLLLAFNFLFSLAYWVGPNDVTGKLIFASALLCNAIVTSISGYLSFSCHYHDNTQANKLPSHLLIILSELEKIDPTFILATHTIESASFYIHQMAEILREQSSVFLDDINQHQISDRNDPIRKRAIDFITSANAGDRPFFHPRRQARNEVAIVIAGPIVNQPTEMSPLLTTRQP